MFMQLRGKQGKCQSESSDRTWQNTENIILQKMPVVKVKRLVFVSSEDGIHCAANLLSPSVSLQWLCADHGNNKRIEIILELAKLSRIKQIEIGNMGSAFVEVLVKSSIEKEDYLSLLPQSMLMSAEESKSQRNLTRTKLFLTDKMSKVAIEKKWLYLKVVCLQPFCVTKQFGLRFIKLFSHSPTDCQETSTPTKTIFTSPSSLTPGRLLSPTTTTPVKLTSLNQHPKSEPRLVRTKTTSLRRKRICSDSNDTQEFEFSGLENQSRLLRNTLQNDNSTIKDNTILSRIATEGRFKKEEEREQEKGFVKKKLLTKELPKVEGVNFLDDYKTKDGNSQNSKRYAMMKLSCLDDSSEIGEEMHKGTRERNKKKRGTVPSGQWINSRKKKCATNIDLLPIPDEFEPLPSDKTKQNSLESYFHKEVDEVITINDDDSVTGHPELLVCETVSNDGFVNCPICNTRIPLYAVEMHASDCAENRFDRCGGNPLADNDVIWCS